MMSNVPSSCRLRTLRALPHSRRFLRRTRARDSRASSPQGSRSWRVWRAAAPSWRHLYQETLKTPATEGSLIRESFKTHFNDKRATRHTRTLPLEHRVFYNGRVLIRVASLAVFSVLFCLLTAVGSVTYQHKHQHNSTSVHVQRRKPSYWNTEPLDPEQRAADCTDPLWGFSRDSVRHTHTHTPVSTIIFVQALI